MKNIHCVLSFPLRRKWCLEKAEVAVQNGNQKQNYAAAPFVEKRSKLQA